MNEIKSRIFRGAAGQGVSQAVTIIIQFASVPIFLLYWDVDLYGEWLILSAIPSYLLMSDLGFGGTAAREMAMLVSGDRRDKALCVFQSVWFLITLISLALILASSVALYLMPIGEWFHFNVMEKGVVTAVLVMMIFQVLLNLQGQLLYAGYNSEGHYGLGTIWLSFIRLSEFIVQMLAIMLGYGPLEVVVVALIARSICTLLMRWHLKRVAPWIVYGIAHLEWLEIKRLTTPAISALAFPLGQALNLQGARIIVGVVMGPVMVVTFASLRTLTRFIAMSLGMINRISQPEISISYGKRDIHMMRNLYRKSCQLALWGGIFLCVLMYFSGGYIFEFWTAGKVIMDDNLFLVMLCASALQSLWTAAMVVLFATNQHSKVAIGFIFCNLFYLILSYFLLKYFGVVEMMLALAAGEATMLILILPSSLRFVGDSFKGFMSEVITLPLFLIRFVKKSKVA